MSEQAQRTLKQGYQLFRQSQVTASEALFRTLLDDPDVAADAHAALGIVRLHYGDHAEAEKLFRLCHLNWGGTAESCYGIGLIYERHDPGYARAHFEFALTKNSNHAGAKTRLEKMTRRTAEPQDVPSPVSEPPPAAAEAVSSGYPSKRERKREMMTGIVSNFSQHIEVRGLAYKKQYQVWNFVVNRAGGQDPVSVQMAGRTSVGVVRDGDLVELPRVPKSRKVLQAKTINNLTRNAEVNVNGGSAGAGAGLPAAILLGAAVLVVLLVALTR